MFVDHLKEKDVNACDAIVLGGGNVLRKKYINELQKIKNKKIYGFSVGVEEPPTENLSFFEHVYARDEQTLRFLKDQNVSCSFVPDAAMILKGDETIGMQNLKKRFKHEKCDLYSNIVTVVINSYMLHGGLDGLGRDAFNFIKFSYDFARVADETAATFVFLPFGTHIPFDDRITNSWVAAKCKYWKKNMVIFDHPDYKESLDIIAASNLVISSRLHSSIFSYVNGVPFIDITHHKKNELFLKMIGKENNSISFWNFDSRILKKKIDEMISTPKHNEHEAFRSMLWEKCKDVYFN